MTPYDVAHLLGLAIVAGLVMGAVAVVLSEFRD